MLLESLVSGYSYLDLYSEDLPYTPPKNLMNTSMFNNHFSEVELTNDDKLLVENCMNNTHAFCPTSMLTANFEEGAEIRSFIDSFDDTKYSDADSIQTCAQTLDSLLSSPKSNNGLSEKLTKRSPKKSPAKTILTEEENNSNSSHLLLQQVPKFGLGTTLKDDLAFEIASVKRIARLALKVLDHEVQILQQEWDELYPTEKNILRIYLEGIYNMNFKISGDGTLLKQINNVGMKLPKCKRNEEKLKKTVKKVNKMIVNTFVSINHLEEVAPDQLATIIFEAYSGNPKQITPENLDVVNIFDHRQSFTQKAFRQIISNRRYAEDFLSILKSNYIREFIKSRNNKVCKSIALIKKKLEDALLQNVGIQQDTVKISTPDIVKRAPWALSDIIAGMFLCESIIHKEL